MNKALTTMRTERETLTGDVRKMLAEPRAEFDKTVDHMQAKASILVDSITRDIKEYLKIFRWGPWLVAVLFVLVLFEGAGLVWSNIQISTLKEDLNYVAYVSQMERAVYGLDDKYAKTKKP